MPSSVHSMAVRLSTRSSRTGARLRMSARLFVAAGTAARRRFELDRVVEREAAVVLRGRRVPAARALIEEHELGRLFIRKVRRDHEALLPARRAAEAVDPALAAGIDGEDRVAQGFALDEIVRQPVERSVEIVV